MSVVGDRSFQKASSTFPEAASMRSQMQTTVSASNVFITDVADQYFKDSIAGTAEE
jgi:hypothetical protein